MSAHPLRIALYQPDIPGNTGTILRLAACLGLAVDIIEPAGFDLSDRNLKRAGMDYIAAATLTLLVGTPAITFIGAVGAAVTVALPRGGLMVSVLILPLAIPVLIFGVSASYAAVAEPDPFLPPFLILCALSIGFAVVGPAAAAVALRWSSD